MIERVNTLVDGALSFWYLLGQLKGHSTFWNTSMGRLILAFLPAIITAALTAVVTVFGVYLSMHDDVLLLKNVVVQVRENYTELAHRQQEAQQRLYELERGLSRVNGLLEAEQQHKQRILGPDHR